MKTFQITIQDLNGNLTTKTVEAVDQYEAKDKLGGSDKELCLNDSVLIENIPGLPYKRKIIEVTQIASKHSV